MLACFVSRKGDAVAVANSGKPRVAWGATIAKDNHRGSQGCNGHGLWSIEPSSLEPFREAGEGASQSHESVYVVGLVWGFEDDDLDEKSSDWKMVVGRWCCWEWYPGTEFPLGNFFLVWFEPSRWRGLHCLG